jgi:hypothetical protein
MVGCLLIESIDVIVPVIDNILARKYSNVNRPLGEVNNIGSISRFLFLLQKLLLMVEKRGEVLYKNEIFPGEVDRGDQYKLGWDFLPLMNTNEHR